MTRRSLLLQVVAGPALATDNLLPWPAGQSIIGDPGVGTMGGPQRPPECKTPDCRFAEGMTSVTAMNCGSTVWDRHGHATYPPACNTETTQWACLTCGKAWKEYGKE